MEQAFQLKYYGNISSIELMYMNAEERAWWLRRLEKQLRKENDAGSGAMSPGAPGGPPSRT